MNEQKPAETPRPAPRAAKTTAGPKENAGENSADSPYIWPLGVAAAPQDVVRIGPAGAGDHAGIHQLLSAVFHAPSKDDFASSLEDPLYEPCDRLVVKRGMQVLGHAHLAQRVVRFGNEALPATALHRLGVLPECRGRDYGRRLLEQADAAMAADGSVLGMLSTRIPHYFRRSDWVVCMRHSHAQVGARDLLAQLSVRGFAPHGIDEEITIRPWRHVELPSLVRLYQERTAKAYGPYERTEAYWRWLVNRYADHVFVALAGPKRFDFDFDDGSIVGYVVQRDDSILELVASDKHCGVQERLLARACGDAIERDHHVVRLHLAPDEPLWSAVETAGGMLHRTEACDGEVTMVKLFDQPEFLRRLLPTLHERLREALSPATATAEAEPARSEELARATELGITVGDMRLCLMISRRSVKLISGSSTKTWIRLSSADFTRLLLGHLDIDEAAASARLKASSQRALRLASALFPRLPLWHPPLDDLLV
ncbi:MAG: GNAT family N-acetyltransferase [Planctomycetia bacterium]|nr:GNAT family N-acetyltransferase [Planctomycetia bacterium]